MQKRKRRYVKDSFWYKINTIARYAQDFYTRINTVERSKTCFLLYKNALTTLVIYVKIAEHDLDNRSFHMIIPSKNDQQIVTLFQWELFHSHHACNIILELLNSKFSQTANFSIDFGKATPSTSASRDFCPFTASSCCWMGIVVGATKTLIQ